MTISVILLIIGILAILAIILDSWRRKWQRQQRIARQLTGTQIDLLPKEMLVIEPKIETADDDIALTQTDALTTNNHIDMLGCEKPITRSQVKSANELLPKKHNASKSRREKQQTLLPEIIVLMVMSVEGDFFNGDALMSALNNAYLYFGNYDIYHRYKYKNGKGPLYFSVASALNPGTLVPEQVSTWMTTGLTLFMRLDNPKHDRIIFKQMLATAQQLANSVNGIVCDDKRSPLQQSTLKYYIEKLNL
jgi:cell division protein ZipA